ncbi:hypothetical protein EDD37DRAFT_646504 [Exophiala viscosa]|uniref:uncharacterized protein n=1 Tax=Exophiala viscosa TaxID=2486360 RepID=UPI002197A356|nr:hypothetical protein EDD37DRAFT_646504 [Exophiala viscosa]
MSIVVAVNVHHSSITSPRGDRLPDFSFAGYHSSNIDLPSINSPPSSTMSPTSGDQTARIQAALDSLSDAGGGALLLTEGKYELDSNITIPIGTVLRGSGPSQTFLLAKSAAVDLITLGGQVATPRVTPLTNITDSYVPIGASTFGVADASKLSVGQSVMVQRAVTDSWVTATGMDDLVRDGKKQTWIAAGKLVRQPRTIMAIVGNSITIDIPLTDTVDSQYMRGVVATYTPPSASSESGIENLAITLNPSCSGRVLSDTTCTANAVAVRSWTTDSWIRNLNLTGFNFFVTIHSNAARITIDRVSMIRDQDSNVASGLPEDIVIEGTQVLVSNCSSYGTPGARAFPVVTGSLVPGPNAVLNHYTEVPSNFIAPHQRWAHGFLVENSRTSLKLYNRGTLGTGQGWTINAGVAWNVVGQDILVESPPMGVNWCAGCIGTNSIGGNGSFFSTDRTVLPESLFWTQLSARGVGRPLT